MAIILDIETVAIDGAADLAEPVTAPANWKDPAKIAAYVAEKQAEQTSRAALYPWTARVVAVGIIDGDQVEHVLTAADEAEEAELLRQVGQTAVAAAKSTRSSGSRGGGFCGSSADKSASTTITLY